MLTTDDFDFCVKFEVPPDYTPPQAYEDQKHCSEYPNINTSQYRQKPANRELSLLPFFQCLSRNSEGTLIVGTNSYNTRRWNGAIYAFDGVHEERPVLSATRETAFKVQTESSISELKFIDDTLFGVAESSGQVTLFSTRSVMRESTSHDNKYCLFSIGQKRGHRSYVNCLDVLQGRQKMISGDSLGWLVIWDLGNADLTAQSTMRFAHSGAINSISASPRNEECFVTASDDKNLYHFDLRDPRPCTALIDGHPFQLKAVAHLNDTQVVVGDKKGIAYVVDTKMPKSVVCQTEVEDRSCHRFVVKGENLVALSDSNRLKVLQFNGKELVAALDTTDAPNFLRAAAWIGDGKEFYVAGWDSYMQKYNI